MEKEIKVWYDKEGDYLEVLFERKEGYCRETEDDALMEKVDERGNVIGFSILKVSALQDKPLSVSLKKSHRLAAIHVRIPQFKQDSCSFQDPNSKIKNSLPLDLSKLFLIRNQKSKIQNRTSLKIFFLAFFLRPLKFLTPFLSRLSREPSNP